MKKLLTIAIVSLLIVSVTKASAQSNLVALNNKQEEHFPAKVFASTGVEAALPSISVSSSVSKKFTKAFPGIKDAAWLKDANGYVVRFTAAGIQNWAFLTKKGTCYGTMRYYIETGLPAAVRNQIRAAYYDFAITSVKEVRYNEKTAYLVTIQDATTWKVIQVVDGNTDVWEEHGKQ